MLDLLKKDIDLQLLKKHIEINNAKALIYK